MDELKNYEMFHESYENENYYYNNNNNNDDGVASSTALRASGEITGSDEQ